MDLLSHLWLGLGVALTASNLLYALAGCLLGTLIGVAPGIGPVAAMALLLPVCAAMPLVSALILLAGIYFGALHGTAITSVLVSRPRAAQPGLATAIAVAGWAALFAGTVGMLVLAALAPVLAGLTLQLDSAENVALLVLVLSASVVFSSGPLVKALAMVVTGLMLGLVGTDPGSGLGRFAFDLAELHDGIGVVVVAMGLFAYGDIIGRLLQAAPARPGVAAGLPAQGSVRKDLQAAVPAVLRGTALGAVLGILPGGGALLATFASSAMEKALKADAGRAGTSEGTAADGSTGSAEAIAVAAPVAAGKAAAHASFLPLLALGIPPNAAMALMAAVMAMHQLQPGPQLRVSQPDMFWGLVVSMGIANLMLVLLNLLPAQRWAGFWARLLQLPYRWLFPALVLCCALGAYSSRQSVVDVWLLAGFGLIGVLLSKLDLSPVPLLLGFMVAPQMEAGLKNALTLSQGDWSVFVTRPLSAILLTVTLVLVLVVVVPVVKSGRSAAFGRD